MLFINNLLDIIFPPKCIVCKKNGSYLCSRCLSLCKEAERECPKWVYPIFDYRNPAIKKAIWLIKYKGRKKLVEVFAEILYGGIIEELSELKLMENFTEPLLIPIPISRKRQKERGFNQTEILCREILRIDRNGYLFFENNILVKTKETEHQARIKNKNERLKNLLGTFEVRNESLIQNRNIILIDDVTTTGATLSEARKTLRSAGANKIIAFTIAH